MLHESWVSRVILETLTETNESVPETYLYLPFAGILNPLEFRNIVSGMVTKGLVKREHDVISLAK